MALESLRMFFGYRKKCREGIKKNGITGREAFVIYRDILHCHRKFHCTPEEYFFYDFPNFSDRERRNFLLLYHQRTQYRLVVENGKNIASKKNQHKLFPELLKRNWVSVSEISSEELIKFIRENDKVVFKPDNGSLGKGIFAATSSRSDEEIVKIYNDIKDENYICEEYIEQHTEMAEMDPISVNTVRLLTLNDKGKPEIIAAGLRTSGHGGICDNMSAGGIGAGIDVETGVVYTPGVDFGKNRYMYHPVSGKQIVGFNIPFWKETVELVLSAAKRLPGYAVIGWDIAYTKDGPLMIEFNGAPGSKLVQVSDGRPKGKKIIDYINKNGDKQKQKSRKYKEYAKKFR